MDTIWKKSDDLIRYINLCQKLETLEDYKGINLECSETDATTQEVTFFK